MANKNPKQPKKLSPPPPPLQLQPSKTFPMMKRWNALDADRIYGKEERTYSQAFVKKLLNSPAKPLYRGTANQPKRERERGIVPTAAAEEQQQQHHDSSSEGAITNISLEGHGLDRSEVGTTTAATASSISAAAAATSNATNMNRGEKKRARKGDPKNWLNLSSSRNQEGGPGERRPTIERGGTNTILMEISGVGSRAVTDEGGMAVTTGGSNGPTSNKEGRKRHKTTHWESEQEAGPDKKMYSATSSKKQAAEEINKDASFVTSAPAEGSLRRAKQKRDNNATTMMNNNDTNLRIRRQPSNNRNTLTITDMDASFGRSSPQELDIVLLEGQVHANPDQAVKSALLSIASEDWNNKCEGMSMVMCVARNYPNSLQSHLHSVVIAVQKEVPI